MRTHNIEIPSSLKAGDKCSTRLAIQSGVLISNSDNNIMLPRVCIFASRYPSTCYLRVCKDAKPEETTNICLDAIGDWVILGTDGYRMSILPGLEDGMANWVVALLFVWEVVSRKGGLTLQPSQTHYFKDVSADA